MAGVDSAGNNLVDYFHKLLRVVLLIINSHPGFYNAEKLLVAIMNCFLVSVEQEWMDVLCEHIWKPFDLNLY